MGTFGVQSAEQWGQSRDREESVGYRQGKGHLRAAILRALNGWDHLPSLNPSSNSR